MGRVSSYEKNILLYAVSAPAEQRLHDVASEWVPSRPMLVVQIERAGCF